MSAAPYLTVGDVARRLGVPQWCVRRLFERGILPPPLRAGLFRLIRESDLPKITAALQEAGYLREEVAADA